MYDKNEKNNMVVNEVKSLNLSQLTLMKRHHHPINVRL